MAEATSFSSGRIAVTHGYFDKLGGIATSFTYPSFDSGLAATGTTWLTATVPAEGCELLAAYFTVHSGASVTTSGANQWSISDGTNVLATMAATSVTGTINSVLTMTPGTSTNGKAIATGVGKRLILTNTETGTVGTGIQGYFTFVWSM